MHEENYTGVCLESRIYIIIQDSQTHTYKPADEPLLEECVKFASFGVFLLQNAVCPFKMYRHGSTKKEGFGDFLEG